MKKLKKQGSSNQLQQNYGGLEINKGFELPHQRYSNTTYGDGENRRYEHSESIQKRNSNLAIKFGGKKYKDSLKSREKSLNKKNYVMTIPVTLSSSSSTGVQKNTINPHMLSKFTYFYLLEKGNNSDIVRRVLSKRSWWQEVSQPNQQYHFRWKPTSSGIKFDEIASNHKIKQVVNHIEYHQELSSKSNLHNNIKHYCQTRQLSMGQFIPKSFIFNLDHASFKGDLQNFVELFLTIENNTSLKNVWLMKPSDRNRGIGIHIFNTLSYFYQLLRDYGKEDIFLQVLRQIPYGDQYIPDLENDESYHRMLEAEEGKQKKIVYHKKNVERRIVMQKYIEYPLLVNNRKFDIRMWALVDQDMKFYFYREGYVRMSSEQFDIDSSQLNNPFIHLTNNAIQKHGPKYGIYEEGNIMSFKEFQKHIENGKKKLYLSHIIQQIKEQIKISMLAAKKNLLRGKERKNCFELFGYDFMIDVEGQVYLIEVNTNPCIEEPSKHLTKLIQRMLNDLFRTTIDKIFSPAKNISEMAMLKNNSASQFQQNCNVKLSDFNIDGYNYYENLWQSQINMNENKQTIQKKFQDVFSGISIKSPNKENAQFRQYSNNFSQQHQEQAHGFQNNFRDSSNLKQNIFSNYLDSETFIKKRTRQTEPLRKLEDQENLFKKQKKRQSLQVQKNIETKEVESIILTKLKEKTMALNKIIIVSVLCCCIIGFILLIRSLINNDSFGTIQKTDIQLQQLIDRNIIDVRKRYLESSFIDENDNLEQQQERDNYENNLNEQEIMKLKEQQQQIKKEERAAYKEQIQSKKQKQNSQTDQNIQMQEQKPIETKQQYQKVEYQQQNIEESYQNVDTQQNLEIIEQNPIPMLLFESLREEVMVIKMIQQSNDLKIIQDQFTEELIIAKRQ